MQATAKACVLVLLLCIIQVTVASKCYTQSSDIVFALDSSFSIRPEDFQRQMSFLRALIDSFTIGKHHIQVGVVSFGSVVHVNVKLNDFDNKRDLKVVVAKIEHLEGGTPTHEAIRFVHTNMFEPENGGRPWAKHQMVLITDGLSSNLSATLLEASIAKSKGIEIFSVGVGIMGRDEEYEIRGVASEPKGQHVFSVENYKALAGIEDAISSAACERPLGDQSQDPDHPDNNGIFTDDAYAACERHAADIVFLMDSSSSIWEPDFRRQIEFIQQVTTSFDIGHDTTRVGVVDYSDAPITLVALTDEQTHKYIHETLSKAPYITGNTNTAMAIRHARTNSFAYNVARRHVAHVMIILTDGQSDNMDMTLKEAELAREDGIKIFAVGIGDKSRAKELMAMASDPDDKFVFHVDDYKKLTDIKDLVPLKACDVAASIFRGQMPAKCPTMPSDVVFVYDKAALSRHHHNYVIDIISYITESRRLNSSKELRFGVMRDASRDAGSVLHDIELTDQWTEANFRQQLDPDTRTAAIDVLIRKVRHKYFHPTILFDFVENKRTIVIFLDSNVEMYFAATIEAIRLRRSHVQIIVVLLGKHVDKREAISLASSPADRYIVESPRTRDVDKRYVVSRILSVVCD